jgi:hypothetical protein
LQPTGEKTFVVVSVLAVDATDKQRACDYVAQAQMPIGAVAAGSIYAVETPEEIGSPLQNESVQAMLKAVGVIS